MQRIGHWGWLLLMQHVNDSMALLVIKNKMWIRALNPISSDSSPLHTTYSAYKLTLYYTLAYK